MVRVFLARGLSEVDREMLGEEEADLVIRRFPLFLATAKNDQTNMIQQCESQKTFFRLVMKLYEAMLIRLIRTIRLT